MADNRVSNGEQTVVPYLILNDAAGFIDFARNVFGAVEMERMTNPDGAIMHAEIRIGDSLLMMGQASEKWAPQPAGLYLYQPDVDETYRRALEAGATSIMEPADQFYGDRSGGVSDPYGNTWWISTRKEELSNDELMRRHAEMVASA